MLLRACELGPDGKISISALEARKLHPQTYQKNTLVHFYLHYNNWSQVLEATCHLLLGSKLTVQLHLIRVTTGMAVCTYRTFLLKGCC